MATVGDNGSSETHTRVLPSVRPMDARRAMSAIGLRLLGLIVAYVLQTALLNAALPTNPDEAPAPPSLAGQLLVAAPSMGDPHAGPTRRGAPSFEEPRHFS